MEHITEIRSGDYRAKINLSRGANCISLRNERHQAIMLREPEYSRELDNPFLYGMPVLFPVNRISGGCFVFEGRTCRFPINEESTHCHLHGLLHAMPFEAAERGDAFLKCVFEKPYLEFPHAFRMEITYALSDAGLRQTTRITNLSEENMPVFLGFHTTFPICFLQHAKKENIRVFAEVSDEIERNMVTYLPTGRRLPPDAVTRVFQNGAFSPAGQKVSRHYRATGAERMELLDTESGMKLVYENDSGFPWRLIYNGDGTEYICLEPMTCMANSPNAPFERADTGFACIAPGETKNTVPGSGCRKAIPKIHNVIKRSYMKEKISYEDHEA